MAMIRLDAAMVKRGIVETRSQAESYIKLGMVKVSGKPVTKAGFFVSDNHKVELVGNDKYVSRAGLKLASVVEKLKIDFKDKTVLDVGSSTGGFTDFALQHGAKKVIAVDVGTNQLHPSLRNDLRVELHEKTDVRSLRLQNDQIANSNKQKEEHDFKSVILDLAPDVVVIDVSFISLREILPHISSLVTRDSIVVAMVKPQFEVYAAHGRGTGKDQINKGIIKNSKIRRDILKEFEEWAKERFVIVAKADSDVAGSKGNLERFYLLQNLFVNRL